MSGARLTYDGVVLLTRGKVFIGMMHPYSFRDVFGEKAYQRLLKLPRVARPSWI